MREPRLGEVWEHESTRTIHLLVRDIDDHPDDWCSNFLTLILYNPDDDQFGDGHPQATGQLYSCYINPFTYTRIA